MSACECHFNSTLKAKDVQEIHKKIQLNSEEAEHLFRQFGKIVLYCALSFVGLNFIFDVLIIWAKVPI